MFDREVVVLDQKTTYAPIAAREDAGTLDDEYNRRALHAIVRRIRDEHVAGHLVLVDSLHATHVVRAGVLSTSSFTDIDRTLHDLGAVIVVLRISEDTIRRRALVGRRGSGFYEYAMKFGATEEERVRYFAREQLRILDLLEAHSCLPYVVLDGEQPADSLQPLFRQTVRLHLTHRVS